MNSKICSALACNELIPKQFWTKQISIDHYQQFQITQDFENVSLSDFSSD